MFLPWELHLGPVMMPMPFENGGMLLCCCYPIVEMIGLLMYRFQNVVEVSNNDQKRSYAVYERLGDLESTGALSITLDAGSFEGAHADYIVQFSGDATGNGNLASSLDTFETLALMALNQINAVEIQLTLFGEEGATYLIQSSNDLENLEPVSELMIEDGQSVIGEPVDLGSSQRFSWAVRDKV
jgi:hypothetical protein